jgi:mevalonate pyrophosphate decarboxylase
MLIVNQLRQNRRQKRTRISILQQICITCHQSIRLFIQDSNSFHSVCLDTYPPVFYMNEFSKQIIKMIDHIINKQSKLTKVAYTFDAGPHGFLFVH